LFTDGLVEAESPTQVRFGVHNALEVVRGRLEESAPTIVAALRQTIDDFTHHRPQADDITIVVLKVLPG